LAAVDSFAEFSDARPQATKPIAKAIIIAAFDTVSIAEFLLVC
jgi:hypothetical protein